MAEPQKITNDDVPDITIEHRLSTAITPEAGMDTAPEIGDEMEDGTIYAGISPDTGKALYVTSEDAPGTLKWKQAMKYAAVSWTHGHKDWRLPTKAELNMLFENHAAIGGFNERVTILGRYYWSSMEHLSCRDFAWEQSFPDGDQIWYNKNSIASVRCVRSELRP